MEAYVKTLGVRLLDRPYHLDIEYTYYVPETLDGEHTVGEFGDAAGYEETLYVTEGGKYFLYVNGGAESPYAKEDIKRMSADKAKEWLALHE